jgi:isopenicillin N synthase-like dioxygenase
MLLHASWLLLWVLGATTSANAFPGSCLSAPVAVSDPATQLIEHQRSELKAFLRAAFACEDAAQCTASEFFALEQLEAEQGRGPVSKRLCSALQAQHHVLVRVPESDAAVLDTMWQQLDSFFALPDEAAKEAAAGPMYEPDGQVIGYANLDGNAFLETRVDSTGRLAPADLHAVQGFEPPLLAARRLLCRVTAAVVAAAGASAELDSAALLRLVDYDAALPPGERLTETVHRLCKYAPPERSAAEAAAAAAAAAAVGNADDGDTAEVTFGAHTDTTHVTLVPCSGTPGLEIYCPSSSSSSTSSTTAGRGRWVRPEAAPGACSRDVVVLSGELLQALTQGLYSAAVHRVVSPRRGRLSAPLLVRGRRGAVIEQGAGAAVLQRMTIDELHRRLNIYTQARDDAAAA